MISPNGIVAHLLSLVKNLEAALDVPSTAVRSTVPVDTLPIALVLTILLAT